MPKLYYKEAQRQAQKEFRACTSRGKYPYLPVLDDFVSRDRLNRGVDLGQLQIPLEFVVGTCTGFRTNAFARNFMPLLEEDSEFAGKWQALSQAHVEEGIRDPIKVYEYMNRYYVQEGNKRVSVLKFFGADMVSAFVTQILPERNGSREVELYYELLDFTRISRISYLEFSRPGSYLRLQQLLGKAPEERWTEDERRDFASAYYAFRQAYETHGGNHLSSTVGDAMLAVIQVYGYQALHNKLPAEISHVVSSLWEEIVLQQQEEQIDVKLTPEEKKPGILAKVLSSGDKSALRVAFVHDKTPTESGWTNSHEQGRLHVQRVFGDAIRTTPYFNALDADPLAVIQQAIQDGNTVIFTTSPRLLPASLRAAVEQPRVTILNCSLNKSHRYIRTYYARMYEAKFIIGAIAGSLAGVDNVGYLCDYPIYGQIAGINAFALGVQMVNPRTKVYLEWSTVGGTEAAIQRLTQRGIRLISARDLTRKGDRNWTSFGLCLISGEDRVVLAAPVWKWGTYYEAMLRRIQDKSFQTEYKESEKALNYYWGMSAGVVALGCTDKVPPSTRKLAELLQNCIQADLYYPFRGKLYAQGGKILEGDLTPEQIIGMDWLAENIVGSIPDYEELNETGKATVDMVGVEAASKDKR
ncbi:BMP family ABC transporter substrate-binding protein [Pseudoflavonifractor phocaeensis]|uniref:BMP family ABC transporter substrate-binding protein n=1 Tax=Pseudoflavonifractor phocaeensis TaxID=1870988 RepID=UPI00195A081E|nr:BMP family ABC transporter substrate-binding protein [Pseudoflavonifractor phocaeensis]MBM6926007.1 BMP family ABC transporter substrate-binding protein [Pseudoflavonifractor phocaeensis]